MANNNKVLTFDTLYKIAQSANLSIDAVVFIVSSKGKATTSRKIIENVIKASCKKYRKQAMQKLSEMGITSGKDIGNIIYKMVDAGIIIEENGDSLKNFEVMFNEDDKIRLFTKYKNYYQYKIIINSFLLMFYSLMMVYIINNNNNNSLLVFIFWLLSVVYTFYLYWKKKNT